MHSGTTPASSKGGRVDLLNAVYTGFRLTPEADFGATYFIPAVIVPALLVTRFLVFRELLKKRAEPEHA